MKMCTDFTADAIRITSNCAVSIANNLDVLRPLRAHQINWLSERQATNKWSQSNHCHTSCGKSQKYLSEQNGNAQNDGTELSH